MPLTPLSSLAKISIVRQILIVPLFLFFTSSTCFGQWPENYSPTYEETIQAYADIQKAHPSTTRLMEAGPTDSGKNLHLLVIDSKGSFDPQKIHSDNKVVCLIINGIHPGEPCGINASLDFARRKAENPSTDVVYVIVPIYNIGGALNRNSTLRVNQDGPTEYGFRGNARNLDLNRDFIKADSKNTRSLSQIYHTWNPHIFVDTHTSNGADYPAAMTLIHTFPEKLNPLQASLVTRDLVPQLYAGMEKRGEPMVPYVNTVGQTPESGLRAFTDLPRYSSGYVALFNTIGFMPEAHMLKPFGKRVEATLIFLNTLDEVLEAKKDLIIQLKKLADEETKTTKVFTTSWKLSGEADSIMFSGYRADSLPSEVTGKTRIRYNQSKPYSENIAYFKRHVPVRETLLAEAYLIPPGWTEVIDRLDENKIKYTLLKTDSVVNVRSTYIENYETQQNPYEGHYLHFNTTTVTRPQEITFPEGSIIIRTNQPGNRYLAHVFNPENDDSFFNWNYFDSMLSQKEYFSTYLFEDSAPEILRHNPTLKKVFEAKKSAEKDFAENANAQLDFIYKNSDHYEKSHKRMPIYAVSGK